MLTGAVELLTAAVGDDARPLPLPEFEGFCEEDEEGDLECKRQRGDPGHDLAGADDPGRPGGVIPRPGDEVRQTEHEQAIQQDADAAEHKAAFPARREAVELQEGDGNGTAAFQRAGGEGNPVQDEEHAAEKGDECQAEKHPLTVAALGKQQRQPDPQEGA